jgi:hypothetical protein
MRSSLFPLTEKAPATTQPRGAWLAFSDDCRLPSQYRSEAPGLAVLVVAIVDDVQRSNDNRPTSRRERFGFDGPVEVMDSLLSFPLGHRLLLHL